MKLKGSVKSIYPDASLILFCIGILVACPLRIYQIFKVIEPSTGFYSDPKHWSVITLYCMLAAVTVIVFIFSFLSKNTPASVLPQGRKIPLGIASILFAGTFVSDILTQMTNLKSSTSLIVNNGQILGTSSRVAVIAQLIFASLSCIYMIIFAISFFIEKNIYSKLRVLALSPVIWAIIRIFARVTRKISFTQVSDLILELVGLSFMIIFFFTFARIASQINSDGTMWRLIACGISVSLFVITYSLPRLMLVITNNANMISATSPLELCDLGAVIFIIVLLITCLRSGYAQEDADRIIKVVIPEELKKSKTEDSSEKEKEESITEIEAESATETAEQNKNSSEETENN